MEIDLKSLGKLRNSTLQMDNFKIIDDKIYKLCTKCLLYKPMTTDYFPKRSNVKCGFDSHCKECHKEKESTRIRIPAYNEKGELYCHRCKQYKPVSEFYENSSDIKCRNYYSSICKDCEKEKHKEYRENTIEDSSYKLIRNLVSGCRGRADRSDGKFTCDLTIEQVMELYEKQKHKCALSGLEMTSLLKSGKCPYNISIDRINPGKDYTISNIRLVCSSVNMMRSNLDDSELYNFCKNIVNLYESKIN